MIIAKSTDSGTRKLLSGNFIWEVRTESPFLILKATWVNSGRTHITAVSASLWKPPSPAWTKATDSSTGQLPPCRALPLSPARSPPLSDTDYVTLSAYPCPPGLRGKPAPHSDLRGFEWLGLCLALCGISRPPSRSPRLTGLLSLLKPAESRCTCWPFSLQTPSRRPRAASARRRLRLCSAVSTAAMLVKVTSPTWTAYLFTLFIFSIVLDRVP